jgi:CubicO group peptidase (beta-lactamase class C family)
MSSPRATRSVVEAGLTPVVRIAGEQSIPTYTLAARMQHYAVPGAAIAVIEDGEVLWSAAHGFADASTRRPLTDDTFMQAASISKAVAAIGVLALVEDGTLDLDADVLGLLRGWRPAGGVGEVGNAPLTLRHLLSHTGGTTVPGFPGYRRGDPLPSAVEVLAGAGTSNTPAVERFTIPGTTMQYSGGGTTIVQLLVTEITGRLFPELMDDLVLRRFGMTASAFEQPLRNHHLARAASGHDELGRPVPGGHHVYPELQAAGLWTTARDLARWLVGIQRILRGEPIGPISQATAELMVTPVAPGTFGLGPELGGSDATRRFGHSGSNEGFRTLADALVERGDGVAVLTNGAGGSALCGEIRRAMASAQEWGPIDEVEITPVTGVGEMLAACTGEWSGPFGRRMRLALDGAVLVAPAAYGNRRLIPVSDDELIDDETGALLRVHRTDGFAARITVHVGEAELMAFTRPAKETS